MIISDQQKDSLTELINIAFGRTAASLSELTGQRVILEVPQVSVHSINELMKNIKSYIKGEAATVHQPFSGPVAGDGMLVLSYEGAVLLASLLTDEQARETLNISSREVLTEAGNILLNACLGMLGNLLRVHLSFSIPRLHLNEIDGVLKSIMVGNEELRYALLIHTAFKLKDSSVSGYLLIALGVSSLDKLLHAVEKWEVRSLRGEQ